MISRKSIRRISPRLFTLNTWSNSVSYSPVDLRLRIIVRNSSKSTLPLPEEIQMKNVKTSCQKRIYHPYLLLLSQLQYLLHLGYNRENSSMNEFHNSIYSHLHLCPAKRKILQILEKSRQSSKE